jgi:hypothetical protein
MTAKGRALMLGAVLATGAAAGGVVFTQASAQSPAVVVYKTPT